MTSLETAALDPMLAEALHANPFQVQGDDGLAAARRRLREASASVPADALPRCRVNNRHLKISSPDGVDVRIYWPPSNPARLGRPPTLIFFHGVGSAWATSTPMMPRLAVTVSAPTPW